MLRMSTDWRLKMKTSELAAWSQGAKDSANGTRNHKHLKGEDLKQYFKGFVTQTAAPKVKK